LSKFQRFVEDPFIFVDNLSLKIKGINFNIFQKDEFIRRAAFSGALIFLACWIAFGFDSTPLQFIHAIYEGIPAWISGEAVDFFGIYHSYYGKEMHYSAFVIYFFLFWALSKSFDKVGVKKTRNLIYSWSIMFLSISAFEWFWILGFSNFQNQSWVSTWQFPQMKILIQNSLFTVAGLLTALYLLCDRYFWEGKEIILNIHGELSRRFFFDAKSWKLWAVIGITFAAALLWIYYPWDVQLLTVPLENGEIWSSSRIFPQTLYTVDLNPADSINAGEWFWIEDNLIHAINTLVKILFSLSTYMVFRVKKHE